MAGRGPGDDVRPLLPVLDLEGGLHRERLADQEGLRWRGSVRAPGGEGHVRFALIEPDDRVAKACAAIGKFLREPA